MKTVITLLGVFFLIQNYTFGQSTLAEENFQMEGIKEVEVRGSFCEVIIKGHEGKTLSCIRGIDSKTKKTVEIYPGEMPSVFPFVDEWDVDNFAFEEFLPPNKNYKETESFDHIHMDKVIEAIIGDLL